MCGCADHIVCGYHTQVIADLLERLAEAEADGDELAAAGLRSELNFYGAKTKIVRANLDREASRG
ncbi:MULTISPECIES: hypothetical protein [unclassified Micromonospora]|uniref:hypothetical protein n=1 Tax=unclassified Micromonospora TaxID=2617518 RepID=UPI00332839C7